MDLGGGLLDAGELGAVIAAGQMDPAGELAAGAAGVLELFMGVLQAGSQRLLVRHGQEGFHMEQLDIQHRNKSFHLFWRPGRLDGIS